MHDTSARLWAKRLTVAACWHLFAVLGLSALGATDASAKRKSLTCSFIARQCLTECSKQAAATFCTRYCAEKRAQCLATGSWDSFGRTFQNVIRK
jgi:hypothetical protein